MPFNKLIYNPIKKTARERLIRVNEQQGMTYIISVLYLYKNNATQDVSLIVGEEDDIALASKP